MDLASHTHMWGFAGTLYALAGAALLWLAIFHATSQHDAMRAQASASDDTATRRAIDAQRFDARAGATLLVIGFFMQATGAVGGLGLNTPGILMLLGLVVGLVVYALAKDLLIDCVESSSTMTAHKPQIIPHPEIHAEPVAFDDGKTVPLRLRS